MQYLFIYFVYTFLNCWVCYVNTKGGVGSRTQSTLGICVYVVVVFLSWRNMVKSHFYAHCFFNPRCRPQICAGRQDFTALVDIQTSGSDTYFMGDDGKYIACLYLIFAGIFPIVVGWLFFTYYVGRGNSDGD